MDLYANKENFLQMLKIRTFKIFIISLLCVFAAGLSACDAIFNQDKTPVLSLGCFPNITHSQALYCASEDILKNTLDGVNVNWYLFNAGPTEIESMIAKRIDIGYIGPVPAITGYEQSGGQIKIIAGATSAGSLIVTAEGSEISSVSQLNGKTVAVPQFGNTQDILLRKILNDAGLSSVEDGGSVNIIQQDNANIKLLMQTGQIDAACVPEPWGSRLVLEAEAGILLSADDIFGGEYCVALVIVRSDYLEENREIVKEFLKQHVIASMDIAGNTEAYSGKINSAIYEYSGVLLDSDVLCSAYSNLEVTYDPFKDSIEQFVDVCLEQGIISSETDVNELVDLSPLNEALRELGLDTIE